MTTIYIPTAGRTGSQLTATFISPRWRDRTWLVAPPEEVEALMSLGHNVIPCDIRNSIARKRQWILDWHAQRYHVFYNHDPRLVMLDDDLRFAKRRLDDPTKFLPLDGGRAGVDWDAMMADVEEMFSLTPLVGVSARGGANRNLQPYRLNVRVHGFFGIDASVAQREHFRFDRNVLMEDFDVVLQMLTRGYQALVLNTYVWDDRGINLAGGCSAYRDHTVQEQAARWMKDTWPNFVSLTERPGWHGAMEGGRLDVRIQWKKAAEAGRETRDILGYEQEPQIGWSTGTLEVM